MKTGLEIGKTEKIEPIKKMVGPLAPTSRRAGNPTFTVENAVMIALLSLALGVFLGLHGEAIAALAAPLLRSVRGTSGSVSLDSIPVVRSFVKR
jgi:hypothetical protein